MLMVQHAKKGALHWKEEERKRGRRSYRRNGRNRGLFQAQRKDTRPSAGDVEIREERSRGGRKGDDHRHFDEIAHISHLAIVKRKEACRLGLAVPGQY